MVEESLAVVELDAQMVALVTDRGGYTALDRIIRSEIVWSLDKTFY